MTIKNVYDRRNSVVKNVFRKILPSFCREKVQVLRGRSVYKSYFNEKECIFIHIPKSAGQSIALAMFGDRHPGHWAFKDYEWENAKKSRDFFTFCLVRNPYDRLMSAYYYLMSHTESELDQYFVDECLSKYKTFEEFVLKGLDDEEVAAWVHFIPQIKFITDKNGKVAINYIGKLEDIDGFSKRIKKELNLSVLEIKKINTSKKLNPEDEYTAEMKQKVYEFYEQDFRMFKYDY